jgi:hypothetical protein
MPRARTSSKWNPANKTIEAIMTTETEVKPAIAQASRDSEEIVETVELEQPEKDYEDVIQDLDDPRAAIYARHNEKRSEEIEGQAGETDESGIETDESKDIIEATPDAATHPDAAEMVEVKVLGTTRLVPKAKVDAQGGIENYQIRAAAQEQMERNAHERAALAARQAAQDERERQWAEKQAALPTLDTQTGQNNPDRSTPTDGQNLEDMARRYQEAVYDDADEAPSILATMVREAAKAGETFDKDAFRKQVKEDVLREQRQAKIVKAGQALINEHDELNMRSEKFDSRMYENIDQETMVVEREHPEWDPEDIVKEAYDRIASWKGNTPPQPETMSDKQAQKRAMTRPKAGTQRYAPPPPPPRATNADYVAAQRKARGLD